jgi:hypothetical protein
MFLSYSLDAERTRLRENATREKNWSRWGPYLSERQWATVREDYSANGDPWSYFPHDHARSRAYRWGEDGLLGITDRQCRLCFCLALWNEADPILKERLFGLTGPQGNHGEDVKELYYHLDSTPTHSYFRALYKYPHAEFPYRQLVEENARRGKKDPEFEINDTGIFAESRYFDVFAEYAKGSPNDLLIRITVANRGPQDKRLHLLPTLWFRNTWIWGCKHEGCDAKPRLALAEGQSLVTQHETLGNFRFHADIASDGTAQEWLFTENETNSQDLFGVPNYTPYVKDAFHKYVVEGDQDALSHFHFGTKAAAHYILNVPAGGQVSVNLRLYADAETPPIPFNNEFDQVFTVRKQEADQFYAKAIPGKLPAAQKEVARQAYAGLLWSKQFYHYIVEDWLKGDPETPTPPTSRLTGRNSDWPQLFNRDVISMPDTWEYPWYASWDLAFHMLPFSRIDPQFAKDQLELFLREWYMHPSGQIPAYEFNFSDVNPPVHAWACWRVYKISGASGHRDRNFLSATFQKLLINFTWWVNRKDVRQKHLFSGGFLGLDNIGVFDRSRPLPTGGHLEQADATAWMAFYCSTMAAMALELAFGDSASEDMASKFFEHFVYIVDAMNCLGGRGLWDEEDGFYYDQIMVDGKTTPLKLRSMVGLIPLFAAEVMEEHRLAELPGFRKRFEWFLKYRPDLAKHITYRKYEEGAKTYGRYLFAIPSKDRLVRVLKYMLDENEFLSPHGIRSLSKIYEKQPYVFASNGERAEVRYVPGESDSSMFGGNSNWRGPVWFPVNYLIIEALQRYHHFYEDTLLVECPTGSGQMMNLRDVALEICRRLLTLFVPEERDRNGANTNQAGACHGKDPLHQTDPHFAKLHLFHEYFNGDTGRGLGASHQTGWTALIIRCMEVLAAAERGK